MSIIASCHATTPHSIKWHEHGRITSSNGEELQLQLQSIYAGLEYEGSTYLTGFKIDAEGINTPYISAIPKDLKQIQYWPFESILNDFFIHNNALHINDVNGNVFQLSNNSWDKIDLTLPHNAHVIYSDSKNRLIVCHAAPLQMAATHESGCYSINPDWSYNFTWFTTTPKICNGSLYIYENHREGGIFKILSLETGEVVYSKAVTEPPENLCDMKGY